MSDQVARDNFQKIQDFANGMGLTQQSMQAVEVFVTANATSLKISHSLGAVPTDVLVTKLIAPSAAKLTILYSEFTANALFITITGLPQSKTLHARLLFGIIPNVPVVGNSFDDEGATQSFSGSE